jgi:hypothetical protein
MWEEHATYQKAQARMIGLMVVVLFVGSVIYCVCQRDWSLLRLVLYTGGSLVVALAFLSLVRFVVVKGMARLQGRPAKPRPDHDA